MKRLISVFLVASIPAMAWAQPNSNPTIAAMTISTSLKIDGVLDEPEWQVHGTVEKFWSNFPADTTQAQSQTRVRVLYNKEFIYFSAILLNTQPVLRYVASSLRRDYPFAENDA